MSIGVDKRMAMKMMLKKIKRREEKEDRTQNGVWHLKAPEQKRTYK